VADRSVCFRPVVNQNCKAFHISPGTGSAHASRISQNFLKRCARFLHYSNEWKRSQRCDPKIHKIPTWKSLGNRGEDLGTSDRRNRMGKRFRRSSGFSNAIFPLSSSLLRSQIILDPVSLLQTSDAAQNPVEEQPLWSRVYFLRMGYMGIPFQAAKRATE